MSDPGDLAAAEYVLGTLSPEERASFVRRLAADPHARAEVRAWEARLTPLAEAVPAADPPSGVWDRIAAALAASPVPAPMPAPMPANDNRVAALSRQVRTWRLAAFASAIAAACLAITLGLDLARRPETGGARYVAVVTPAGEAPALIVSLDTATGSVQVRPVAATAPAGRALQLWFVGAEGGPKPMGVIGSEAERMSLPVGTARGGEGSFAVSVEPPGGSPTACRRGP